MTTSVGTIEGLTRMKNLSEERADTNRASTRTGTIANSIGITGGTYGVLGE